MAEYCEYNIGMRLDANLPSLAAVGVVKKEQLSPKDAISGVRALMNKTNGIEFPTTDDAFIMRFLLARKMVVADAFQLIVNYVTYRQRNRNLFSNLSLNQEPIRNALLDGFPGILGGDDRKGRCVLIIFTANWDHNAYSLITVYQALLLVMEKMIESVRYQENGFVMIVDWTDFSFRQSSNLNPKVLKLMLEGLQDCFPARFKGIHFINQPWYVEAALTVIRPFLKEKTKRKIYLHGNNLSTLHEHVSKYILPAELGGDGPSFSPSKMADTILSESPVNGAEGYSGGGGTSESSSPEEEEKSRFPEDDKDSDDSSDENAGCHSSMKKTVDSRQLIPTTKSHVIGVGNMSPMVDKGEGEEKGRESRLFAVDHSLPTSSPPPSPSTGLSSRKPIRKSETVPAHMYTKQKLTRTSGAGKRSLSSARDDEISVKASVLNIQDKGK